MTAKWVVPAILFLFLAASPSSAKGKKHVETKPEHEAILRQAMALHDQGKYTEAIAEYAKVLAENPDDVLAIYETAYSLSAQKEFKQCESWAERGLGYDTSEKLRVHLIVILGSCQDDAGDSEQAVKTYKRGIKEFRDASMLHFNLGVTYKRMGKQKEARQSLQEALRMDPLHASSHFVLGQVYLENRYRIPGVLALSRFLVLEPASERSQQAVGWILSAVHYGAESKEPGKITINLVIPTDDTKDEGDFASADMSLGLMMGGMLIDKLKDRPPHEKLGTGFSVLFENVLPEKKKPSGFAQEFYGPYFDELGKKKFTDVFLHFAFRNLKGADDTAWIEANRDKIREFLSWSEHYAWKRR